MGTYERKQKKSEGSSMENYLKKKIISEIEKMDDSDIKFLNQILTLVNSHLNRTGRL